MMAIRAIAVGGTAIANTTTNFLSDPIVLPIRPVSLIVSWSGAETEDEFSVFLTKSDTPIPAPQPGDPPSVQFLGIKTVTTAGTIYSIPIVTREMLTAPLRLALSYKNTNATTNRTVQAVLFYDDMPL